MGKLTDKEIRACQALGVKYVSRDKTRPRAYRVELWEQLNGKGSCLWGSEIDEFCLAVSRIRMG